MDKIPFVLPQRDGKFGTYVSKYPVDSDIIPMNGFTGNTRNMVTSVSGQMEKLTGGLEWNPNSLLSGPPLDQYEGVFTSGKRLLIVNDAGTLKASSGNNLFSTITGGTGFSNPAYFEFATYQNRVYGSNGIDNPIVIDTIGNYGGVPYTFTLAKVKTMGAQAPSSAPTAGTPTSGGSVPDGAHTYKITFVYYNGVEESNGSPASSPQTAGGGNNTIPITSIPIGGYGVTARNIYRDNNDGNWLLLDTLPNNTATTYTDTLLIGATPTPIPFQNNVPPLIKYPTLFLDRIFAVDVTGKNILWSLAGEPDVFQPQNSLAGPQDDILTALFLYNGVLYAFGQHTVGQILGTTDNTFFYYSLSKNTGCVDNRSIQIRELISNPTMMWLASSPNKGIYYTNGYTVQYLSDVIEDLTFDLSQIKFLENQDTQDTEGDFAAGTASPAIDLMTNPGAIQTINPKYEASHAADWSAGIIQNLSQIGDELAVPTAFSPSDTSGSFSGSAQDSSGNITLSTSTNFPGQSGSVLYSGGIGAAGGAVDGIAQKINPARSGLITSVTLPNIKSANGNVSSVSIWTDSGGKPGSQISTNYNFVSGTLGTPTIATAVHLTGGTNYWIMVLIYPVGGGDFFDNASDVGLSDTVLGKHFGSSESNPSSWDQLIRSPSNVNMQGFADWTFSCDAIASSGVWTSPIFDSQCTTETSGMALALTGSYPGYTTSTVTVQGRNGTSGAFTVTDTLANPNGSNSLTGGMYRYWQIVYNLSTPDNRTVPTLSAPTLTFNTTGLWVSPAILCTTDITTLDTLTDIITAPAGTSSSIEIATSADNITYTSFGPIGSATPQQWAKIRVLMTATSDDTTSPILSDAKLTWSVVATFISSIIDTGANPPNGWGQFIIDIVNPGVSTVSEFRSASSSGGIPGALFIPLTNGQIPTNTPLEFCQWEVILSASADNIPSVISVTVQWLIGASKNLRCASAFFNKSYYLKANKAEDNSPIIFEFDYQGNWRIHDALNVGTLGTYFNQLFYGDATLGEMFLMFAGTPVGYNIETKCLDYDNNLVLKTIRSYKVKGVGTGTTIHVYYSVDRGNTWIEMLNSSGTLGFVTPSDGLEFVEYFGPVSDGSEVLSGRNIIYRLASTDTIACRILQVETVVYRHKGKLITEATA